MHTLRTPPKQDAHPQHRSEPHKHRVTHELGNRRRLDLHLTIICTLTWVWDKHRTVLRCAQCSRGFNRANLRALYEAQDKPTGAGAAINSSGREAQHEIYLSISYTNVSI